MNKIESIFLSAREHGEIKTYKRKPIKKYKVIEVSTWNNDIKTLWVGFYDADGRLCVIMDSDQIINLAKMIPTLKKLLM